MTKLVQSIALIALGMCSSRLPLAVNSMPMKSMRQSGVGSIVSDMYRSAAAMSFSCFRLVIDSAGEPNSLDDLALTSTKTVSESFWATMSISDSRQRQFVALII